MFRLFPVLVLCGLVSACAPVVHTETASRAQIADSALPPMKSFARTAKPARATSNQDLVRDFLDLSFQLESGRELPVFTRFLEPVTVRVTGRPPASLNRELSHLIGRLRSEAKINIQQVSASQKANITVEAIPRSELRSILPQAACFVVPNVSSVREYRATRRSAKTSWTQLKIREKLAIVVPSDAPPQEVRDCLHEELAQALGPLNDLYRLSNSVFNDDNVHTVLTGQDMLMLRAYYAPELRNGMTRAEVAARLPAVFARLNPAGEQIAPRFLAETPKAYVDAIQTALGPGARPAVRLNAANAALRIASQQGWTDHRRAFAHFAKARLIQSQNPRGAYEHFVAADQYYRQLPDTRLHRAHVSTHLAAYAIYQGDGPRALAILGDNDQLAAESENAALLSTLMLLRAEALEMSGQTDAAQRVRLDSLGWARYGFGSDWAVRNKLDEIRALRPRNG
ncbi:MAG: DUF2927 domain-containing protein [Rhodobacteraceae bacterium]|nr:DUF2927 domain-containing protein [Paracoccaceae bacterium]